MTRKKRTRTKKPGQLMLWRSGFGYDLVEYVCEANRYYHCTVKMLTGILVGDKSCIMEDELTDITKEAFERYHALYPKFQKAYSRYGKRLHF